jgi:hypothetical protein
MDIILAIEPVKNSVGFLTGLRKSGPRPAFSLKSRGVVSKLEVF